MKKTLRIAVLSTTLALCAAPVFADPTGTDPPPPKQSGNGTLSMGSLIVSILTGIAG